MLDGLKSHYKRFGKFAVVGVLNTLIDFAVFSILLYGMGIYYIYVHIGGFIVANVNSFILNSLWTFKALRREAVVRQAISFFLISLCGLGVSTVALSLAVGVLDTHAPEMWLPHLFGKVFASGVSLIWNYIGSALFVFKSAGDEGVPDDS